ncbi:protease pro-enzyme activation domain-containing protein [Aquirhabdus sp.]|uniref:protease pro-enzyme activation domain-containing protein n=1 Tax=Aquirhabdus sp. TaxID=2824160 RepID=UPI00396C7446
MRSLATQHPFNVSPLKTLATACVLVAASVSVHADEAWVSTHTRAFAALPKTTTIVANDTPVHITVALKLRNEEQLNKKIEDGTPHPFLTPAQFAAVYSPTQQQADQVSDYLKKSGFHNISIAPNRLLINAEGTAENVQTAFNTPLQQFTAKDGRQVYANTKDAQVPQSLADTVDAVLGLQNIYFLHVNPPRAKVPVPATS